MTNDECLMSKNKNLCSGQIELIDGLSKNNVANKCPFSHSSLDISHFFSSINASLFQHFGIR